MAKKKKESGSGGLLVIFLLAIGVIFSMITFAPGIVVASLVDQVKPLTIGPLWGTTLTTTLVILAVLYFNKSEGAFMRYFLISCAVFVIGLIYTLFDDTNIIYTTVKRMYPFIENMIKEINKPNR
ncbi:MAG: hypothetical protein ACK5JC_11740 [Bacteroidota bacterium]|jgi:hypothetical protein